MGFSLCLGLGLWRSERTESCILVHPFMGSYRRLRNEKPNLGIGSSSNSLSSPLDKSEGTAQDYRHKARSPVSLYFSNTRQINFPLPGPSVNIFILTLYAETAELPNMNPNLWSYEVKRWFPSIKMFLSNEYIHVYTYIIHMYILIHNIHNI